MSETMLIEMNLDEKIVAKIRELVEKGSWYDEKEVIIRAIENLYERTKASEIVSEQQETVVVETLERFRSTGDTDESKPDFKFHDTEGRQTIIELKAGRRLDIGKLPPLARVGHGGIRQKGNYVSHECKIPKPEEIYGTAYAGLMWGFHNRFLPVKFIITVLAQLMIEREQAWVDFNELRNEVGSQVKVFSSVLRSQIDFTYTAINGAVGFPKTSADFSRMPRLRKMSKNRRKEKCQELEIVSKNRFIDQFVGRELNSDGDRRVAGAAFEMGLMTAGSVDEDSELQVTLSKHGREFVSLDYTETAAVQNPVFNQLCGIDKLGTPIKSIFSESEADFILAKIIPKFELEDIVFKKFLSLSEKASVKEITKIFLETQKQHLQKKHPQQYDQELIKHLEIHGLARATTIMTRLVELGKIKKIRHGLSIFYIANDF